MYLTAMEDALRDRISLQWENSPAVERKMSSCALFVILAVTSVHGSFPSGVRKTNERKKEDQEEDGSIH